MASNKNLVIVESPAKAKTIAKFLGDNFRVMSSYGHIRDLKSSTFSIDVGENFAPIYEIPDDKTKVVEGLQRAANQSDVVWLASDEDREGEAIAWHLYHVLQLKGKKVHRIAFHEITKTAIQYAIQHPRDINLDLVNAQQARRILDRIVGFELSPVLWRRIRPSLSAGRVQSVALRLIVEREQEVSAFKAVDHYRLKLQLATAEGTSFWTTYTHELESEEATQMLMRQTIAARKQLYITQVEHKPGKRTPPPPFTTSTLQQEAARRLGMSVNTTMRVAQSLYERGLITYMRTDSVNLSNQALHEIREVILEQWGDRYYQLRHYQSKIKGAQEAHEAIRPSYLHNETITGTKQEQDLYELIRRRTLASQMADAQIERTLALISAAGDSMLQFEARGEVIAFDGFIAAYNIPLDEEEKGSGGEVALPRLSVGDPITLLGLEGKQTFSKPKPRYSEASLVRRMEELGIGRPSTYAPTIQTIQSRDYVRKGDSEGELREIVLLQWSTLKEDKIERKTQSERTGGNRGKLIPTDMGIVVTEFLVEYFSHIMDYNFTAGIEEQFDQIAQGKEKWQKLIEAFYNKFHPIVEEHSQTSGKRYAGDRILGVDPQTGKTIIARIGRYGPMVQLGETTDSSDPSDKPRFASIPSNMLISTITLEEAMKLFALPRTLGLYDGEEVIISSGRFGPYIRHKDTFVSIYKNSGITVETITLEEAIALLQQKRSKEESSLLRTFSEEEDLSIRKGRWGAYLKKGKNSYKLTADQIDRAQTISYEEVLAIIAAKEEASPKTRSKGATKKNADTKKGVTKKSTSTKKSPSARKSSTQKTVAPEAK